MLEHATISGLRSEFGIPLLGFYLDRFVFPFFSNLEEWKGKW